MGRMAWHKPAHEVADRLIDWHDQAKLAGRESRANDLLDLAWAAFDPPALPIMEVDRETIRELTASVVRWGFLQKRTASQARVPKARRS
jgi:hypothetical protein